MVGEQQQILLSPYSIREKSMVVKYIIIPLLEGNRAVQGSGVHFFAKPEVGAAFITPIRIKLRAGPNLSLPARVVRCWDGPCAAQSDSPSAYSQRWSAALLPLPLHTRQP